METAPLPPAFEINIPIVLNGHKLTMHITSMTYEQVMGLAGHTNKQMDVAYHSEGKNGTLGPGDTVILEPDMEFITVEK